VLQARKNVHVTNVTDNLPAMDYPRDQPAIARIL
jgi:hypothetical protein